MTADPKIGARVKFRDDHPTYPGMVGTVDADLTLPGGEPMVSVTLDPVPATADEIEAWSGEDTPPVTTQCRECKRPIRDPWGGGEEWWDAENDARCTNDHPFHFPALAARYDGDEPMTADDRTHYDGDGCPEHPARVHEPTMFCDGGLTCPGAALVCDWCGTYIRLDEQGYWRDRHGDAGCPAADSGGYHEPAAS